MSSAPQTFYLPPVVSGRAATAPLSDWHSWPCVTLLEYQFLWPAARTASSTLSSLLQQRSNRRDHHGEAWKVAREIPAFIIIMLFEFTRSEEKKHWSWFFNLPSLYLLLSHCFPISVFPLSSFSAFSLSDPFSFFSFSYCCLWVFLSSSHCLSLPSLSQLTTLTPHHQGAVLIFLTCHIRHRLFRPFK